MTPTRELERMNVDDLTAEIVRLSKEREALRDEQKRVSDVRDRKLTAQYERERLLAAGLSEERVDAIAKVDMQAVASTEQGMN